MTKKLSFKKIICNITTCCMIFTLIAPTQAFAALKGSTSTVIAKENISTSTVITKENIYEVLDYLGLDSSSFTPDTTGDYDTCTVGDLKAAIQQVNSQPREVTKSVNIFVPSHSFLVSTTRSSAVSGTKNLEANIEVDPFVLTYDVTGQYTGTEWTGVGGVVASVDTDAPLLVYKITDKSVETKFTSSVITLDASTVVTSYIGVADVGLVFVTNTRVISNINWYAHDYL